MITLNVIEMAGKDMITGSYNGIQFSVAYDAEKYALMAQLQEAAGNATDMASLQAIVDQFAPLAKESYKDVIETKTPYIVVNPKTNAFHLRYGNKVSNQPLPSIFAEKIIKMAEKGLPIDPLIKCWARYMRPVKGRPDYNLQQATLFARYIAAVYTDETKAQKLMESEGIATDVARTRATTTQVSITPQGLLVCYKVSRELKDMFILDENEQAKKVSRFGKTVDPDTGLVSYTVPDYVEDRTFEPYIMGQGGDAFNCVGDGTNKQGHIIKVGCLHFLDTWDQVGAPGRKGLHCGGLNYIKGFQHEDTMTHNILVDPMHIHSIAGLGVGNDGAMTVKQYFVHSSFAGVNRTVYFPSNYAALTDAEYGRLVQEAVEASAARQEELKGLLEEAHALAGNPAPGAADAMKLIIEQ